MSFRWSSEAAAPRQPAGWVAPLKQESAREKQVSHHARLDGSFIIAIFGLAVVGGGLLCFAWPLWVLVHWKGIWRSFSAQPLLLVVFWIWKDARDLSADPTSHNLLRFECIEAAVLIGIYMLVVSLIRPFTVKTDSR